MDYQYLTPDRQRDMWQHAIADLEGQHYLVVMNIALAPDAGERQRMVRDAGVIWGKVEKARAELAALITGELPSAHVLTDASTDATAK